MNECYKQIYEMENKYISFIYIYIYIIYIYISFIYIYHFYISLTKFILL